MMALMDTKSTVGNMSDPLLLEKIDKLFACGVGDYIQLPQLVVVGDQSSGKSSVLEGLSNLPFPRDSGLCTRFATQITFRRAATSSISVSIIPDNKNTDEEHVERVKNWSKSDLKELDSSSFSEIMAEVQTVMGLGETDENGDPRTFSEDVLRLEICGPGQEHFSIVDVPGIFRKTTEGVTTKADQVMVNAMVRRYMENSRSIMLAVIPANVDIATQEILTMAEEVDPDGQRTIGVLTKPDLVDSGAEASVVDLIEGRRHRLNLGWCIVRNPGQKQLLNNTASRSAIEKSFFRDKAPWNTLDKERVGVVALRSRLQEILTINIRREFNKVKTEIHKMLATCRKELARLGAKRETPDEQRHYLMELSVQFQKISEAALSAKYNVSDWLDQKSDLRFATVVVTRNEDFASELESYGHTYAFDDKADPEPEVPQLQEVCDPEVLEESEESEELESDDNDQKTNRTTIVWYTHDEPVIIEDLPSSDIIVPRHPGKEILRWLKEVYKDSRGFELGTFDSSLIGMTMKEQSKNWEALALGYIKDVVYYAHDFITKLMALVCTDMHVRDGLMSALMDELSKRYNKAVEHAQFLLHIERKGTPATLNHYFNENLQKSRQTRLRHRIEGATPTVQGGNWVRPQDYAQVYHKSNMDHLVLEIHDILKSYYKVARKRFVDNMCMQAADYHLVTGPESPLRLFSPTFVSNLSEEQLVEIAGEDAMLRRKRAALNKEIADLEAGKKVLS